MSARNKMSKIFFKCAKNKIIRQIVFKLNYFSLLLLSFKILYLKSLIKKIYMKTKIILIENLSNIHEMELNYIILCQKVNSFQNFRRSWTHEYFKLSHTSCYLYENFTKYLLYMRFFLLLLSLGIKILISSSPIGSNSKTIARFNVFISCKLSYGPHPREQYTTHAHNGQRLPMMNTHIRHTQVTIVFTIVL